MHGHAVQGRQRQFDAMPIGRSNHQPQHDAPPVNQHRTLDPELAAIGRISPGFFPLPAVLCSSPYRATANAKRCAPSIVLEQAPFPQFAEHAPRHPPLKVTVQAASRTQRPRYRLPRTTGPHHIINAVRDATFVQRWPTAVRMRWPLGDQLSHSPPQAIRQSPVRKSAFHGLALL